jgi:hypothetical protein
MLLDRPRRRAMFDEFNGLPIHALIVHGTVVLVPLSALLAVLFVIPKTHGWARIPFILVTLGTVPLVWVSKQSGEALKENFIETRGLEDPANAEWLAQIDTHQERADLLFWLVLAFAVVAVVAYIVASSRSTSKALYQAMCVLLVVGAAVVTVQVVRVGDAGARAVWNPTGDNDYSSSPRL